MYAIAQIIYGIPLMSNPFGLLARSPALDDAIDAEEAGYLSYYSGSSDVRPEAFGVKLGEFDEACSYVDVGVLPLTPTDAQRAEFNALMAAQPPALQKELAALGPARVMFLWSTS